MECLWDAGDLCIERAFVEYLAFNTTLRKESVNCKRRIPTLEKDEVRGSEATCFEPRPHSFAAKRMCDQTVKVGGSEATTLNQDLLSCWKGYLTANELVDSQESTFLLFESNVMPLWTGEGTDSKTGESLS